MRNVVFFIGVLCFITEAQGAPSFLEQQREREWTKEAGPKPSMIDPATGVPQDLLSQIVNSLKDPDSFRFIATSGVQRARVLSNNKPRWVCRVDFDGKNSYGAYTGGKSEWYEIEMFGLLPRWKKSLAPFKLESGGIVKPEL